MTQSSLNQTSAKYLEKQTNKQRTKNQLGVRFVACGWTVFFITEHQLLGVINIGFDSGCPASVSGLQLIELLQRMILYDGWPVRLRPRRSVGRVAVECHPWWHHCRSTKSAPEHHRQIHRLHQSNFYLLTRFCAVHVAFNDAMCVLIIPCRFLTYLITYLSENLTISSQFMQRWTTRTVISKRRTAGKNKIQQDWGIVYGYGPFSYACIHSLERHITKNSDRWWLVDNKKVVENAPTLCQTFVGIRSLLSYVLRSVLNECVLVQCTTYTSIYRGMATYFGNSGLLDVQQFSTHVWCC